MITRLDEVKTVWSRMLCTGRSSLKSTCAASGGQVSAVHLIEGVHSTENSTFIKYVVLPCCSFPKLRSHMTIPLLSVSFSIQEIRVPSTKREQT